MKKLIVTSIFLLLFTADIFGQNKADLEKLNREFQLFNYSKVISLADGFIADKGEYSENELIEIYLLKGISHYSLGESELVKSSFFEILNFDNNYKINPSQVSPKIIREFEKLRLEYERANIKTEFSSVVKTDTLYKVDTLLLKPNNKLYSETVIRSMAFPGWGHLYSGNKTKGLILTAANSITLGSMLYFIYDTNQKKSSYLNEIDPALIDKKYNAFNTSYKIRNGLIAAYALLWIYTQIDILFISEIPFVPVINTSALNNSTNSFPTDIQFTMQFQL
ncbi:MAG: hypothetical protein L3J41_10635 [Melioribacteraceae bacterium]|nr:hypothetical protein [Melioribacteraceae bacterium]